MSAVLRGLVLAVALLSGKPALAQSSHHHADPVVEKEEVGTESSETDKSDPVESMDHAAMGHDTAKPVEPMDHAAMGHDTTKPTEPVDQAAMGHDTAKPAEPVDHAAMGHDMPKAAPPVDHGAHQAHRAASRQATVTPIPAVTAADRAAAVKPAGAHLAHGSAIHRFLLFDRLEAWEDDGESAMAWEVQAWHGGDLHRLWLRSEGELSGGDTEAADLEVLYGRSISPWWDVVAGVRHDFGDAPSQTFAAIGVQGLAPYKFEVAATAYIGQSGQTALRLEGEYDTLLSRRLILQWVAEAEAYGQRDPRRHIGAGLDSFEAGLRLRYEIRREFAPYLGVSWERRFGAAADWQRSEGHDDSELRLVAGLRVWF